MENLEPEPEEEIDHVTAAEMPAPLDNPGEVKIALVRYLSTGDFFQSYLSGVETQAEAIGLDLRIFDSRQDAALQADMVDQAIALGVDGIIIQHESSN